jgi:hypothetical protein
MLDETNRRTWCAITAIVFITLEKRGSTRR